MTFNALPTEKTISSRQVANNSPPSSTSISTVADTAGIIFNEVLRNPKVEGSPGLNSRYDLYTIIDEYSSEEEEEVYVRSDFDYARLIQMFRNLTISGQITLTEEIKHSSHESDSKTTSNIRLPNSGESSFQPKAPKLKAKLSPKSLKLSSLNSISMQLPIVNRTLQGMEPTVPAPFTFAPKKNETLPVDLLSAKKSRFRTADDRESSEVSSRKKVHLVSSRGFGKRDRPEDF